MREHTRIGQVGGCIEPLSSSSFFCDVIDHPAIGAVTINSRSSLHHLDALYRGRINGTDVAAAGPEGCTLRNAIDQDQRGAPAQGLAYIAGGVGTKGYGGRGLRQYVRNVGRDEQLGLYI